MFIGPVDAGATKKINKQIAGQESRDRTRKKQYIKQGSAEEQLSKDSRSSSLKQKSEVSINEQQNEDLNLVLRNIKMLFIIKN